MYGHCLSRKDLEITDREFLLAFRGEIEKTYFRMFVDDKERKQWLKKNGTPNRGKMENYTLQDNRKNYLRMQLNFQAYQEDNLMGIYFVVNSGGQYDHDIKKVTAHYVDLDLGKIDTGEKDAEGNHIYIYNTIEKVEQLKKENIEKLDKFKLVPSIVTETANGFHIYWLMQYEASIAKFQSIQEELIKYFKSDEKIKNLSRVLRVVGYKHLKNAKNPFWVKAIKFNPEIKYTQNDICGALGVVLEDLEDHIPVKTVKGADKAKNTEKKEPQKKAEKDKKESSPIDTTVVKDITVQQVNTPAKEFDNFNEMIDYIKQQNPVRIIQKLMPGFPSVNENEHFCCVFHPDNDPSSVLWRTTTNRHWKYMCFGHCEVINEHGEDVISLIIKIKKDWDVVQSLEFLKGELNIKLSDDKWIKEQEDKYKLNMVFKKKWGQSDELREKYPNLYKIMRSKGWLILNEMLIVAFTSINRAFQFNNQGVFYVSNRYLVRQIHYDAVEGSMFYDTKLTTVNQYVNVLCALNLVRKLNLKEIPSVLKERAEKERIANSKDKGINMKTICFYTYNNIWDVVDEAEEIAKKMINSGFSIKSMGKSYLLEVLGEDIADVVYPGVIIESNFTPIKQDAIYNILIKSLKTKRYFCFKDITDIPMLLTQTLEGKMLYLKKLEKQRMYKTVANRIMNEFPELVIEKKKLNKELKKKLKIKDKGFFDVYYITTNKRIK